MNIQTYTVKWTFKYQIWTYTETYSQMNFQVSSTNIHWDIHSQMNFQVSNTNIHWDTHSQMNFQVSNMNFSQGLAQVVVHTVSLTTVILFKPCSSSWGTLHKSIMSKNTTLWHISLSQIRHLYIISSLKVLILTLALAQITLQTGHLSYCVNNVPNYPVKKVLLLMLTMC